METIIKVIHSQDAGLKISPKNSGETSLNISNEILEYITNPIPEKGEEMEVSFVLYKDDFIKGLAQIITNLPLYKSSSKSSTKVDFTESFFNGLYNSIQEFFGTQQTKEYKVNLNRRSDSRIYLNELKSGSFSIRNFLIEEITVLKFSKDESGRNVIHLDVIDRLSDSEKDNIHDDHTDEECSSHQIIYYGAPGTGKSHGIKMKLGEYEGCPEEKKVPKQNIFRTTFHPDSDYSTFVGAYKPTMSKNKGGVKQVILDYENLVDKFKEYLAIQPVNITKACVQFGHDYHDSIISITGQGHTIPELVSDAYKSGSTYDTNVRAGMSIYETTPPVKETSGEIIYSYTPQAFLKAYIRAYQVPTENVYLVIEEINRGNCAQIFGDLFQLLDRDENGKSEYTIKADDDLKTFLEDEFKKLGVGDDGIKDGELCLPSNLYIYATMNTSDQSLFPIDSAFKRRWDWEYEPIKYKNTDWIIKIDDDHQYKWVDFQKEVNDRIFGDTSSEDKMLGDYFVNPSDNIITKSMLLNKILFYLWNDVCKDGGSDIFPTDGKDEVTFSKLYGDDSKLIAMMDHLGLTPLNKTDSSKEKEVEPTETPTE